MTTTTSVYYKVEKWLKSAKDLGKSMECFAEATNSLSRVEEEITEEQKVKIQEVTRELVTRWDNL